ncbi:MAG: hypothetical protein IIW03_04905 [Clostridia bacterium]|nr:hypothetical protein [Clostridia bacterium]
MINYIEKYHSHLYYILTLCLFGLFVLQRIPYLSLTVATATPTLLLPAVIVIACFLREWTGFWVGLISGIALDTVTNGTSILNTLLLLVIGVAAGLAFRLFLNRNLKAVLVFGIIVSVAFYLIKWLFLDLFAGDSSAFALLFYYHLPSALYTAAFSVPFYYFVRWLSQKYLIEQ